VSIGTLMLIWFAGGICFYLAGTHFHYDSPLVIWFAAAWPPAIVCLLIGIMMLVLATAYNYILVGDK
jgi:hypothetical protein